MTTKRELLEDISFHYLKELSVYTNIIRYQGNYFYKKDYVRAFGRQLSKIECEYLNREFNTGMEAKKLSLAFKKRFRPDEDLVRYNFRQHLSQELEETNHDEVIFYEFPISNVRSDINRFNGMSHVYELKSPRDSTNRLENQLETYQQIFEYVHIVIPDNWEHECFENENIGIYKYDYPEFNFITEKKPKRIVDHNSKLQLIQLQESEIRGYFESGQKFGSRDEMIEKILQESNSREINLFFKEVIKGRYGGDNRNVQSPDQKPFQL